METQVKPRQPKPEGAPIRGSMGTIVDNKAVPVAKSEPQDQPVAIDDKAQGNTLANECIAVQRASLKAGAEWPTFARRVRALTIEGREQFLKAVRAWLASLRTAEREAAAANVDKDNKPEPTKEEAKAAAALVSSATTEVSKLVTIAAAWNDQATDEGLVRFYRDHRPRSDANVKADDVPYAFVYRYAASLRGSKAGRKAEPFAIVMQKLLEQRKPREEAGDGEAAEALHKALVALVAEAVAALPAAQKDPLTKAELLGQ